MGEPARSAPSDQPRDSQSEPGTVHVDLLAERLAGRLDIPASTYRLQLGTHLTFNDVTDLAPYLASLGVGAVYLSPCLQARRGSTHGYDVVDYGTISRELGGMSSFEGMAQALRARGMGVILDFVPNHMGVDPVENRAWRSLLEHGPSALTAEWFDFDWRPVKATLHDKILLPILADQYGEVLERGELRVAFEDGVFEVHYFDHRLPINPRQSPLIFESVMPSLAEAGLSPDEERELRSILTAFANMPVYTVRERAQREERRRESRVAYDRLARLLAASAPARNLVERAIVAINGAPGNPASFDRLDALLERQAYRLAYWRTAFDEINYRRFFDVNELAAVRMEEPQVFDDAHRLVVDLIARDLITGLRIDHPDGLADPEAYFERLQAAVWRARVRTVSGQNDGPIVDALVEWRRTACAADPRHWAARPLYVVAEKILTLDEQFPRRWAIHGGTGYRFLNHVNGLFIDPAGLHQVIGFWSRFAGRSRHFDEIAYECRRLVAQSAMASEVNMLGHALESLANTERRTRDFTLNSLRKVLREVIAVFPRYRTYVTERGVSDADRLAIATAVDEARRRSPVVDASIFNFVQRVLAAEPANAGHEGRLQFAMRVQQLTGPIQAKGLEDTAFYRYIPLLAVNEVGSHPASPTLSVEQFHQTNTSRLADWPSTMTTLTTHDTKRSGDARARLAVLSEVPGEWRRAVAAWSRLNARHRVGIGQAHAPDRQDEYCFYQALVAIWPPEHLDAPVPSEAPGGLTERLADYMVKALREAKERSSWVRADAAYEEATISFIHRVTRGSGSRRFLARFVPFARSVARLGALNSLAQLLVQLASPGVPDVYQGGEDWQLSLVDPDNRRPIDFARLASRLGALEPLLQASATAAADDVAAHVATLAEQWPDGRIKTWVMATGLRHRRANPDLFAAGSYVPVTPEPSETPLIAFARASNDRAVLIVAPRFAGRLGRGGNWPTAAAWGDSSLRLPPSLSVSMWRDLLTGRELHTEPSSDGSRRLPVATVFGTLPLAWLGSAPVNA